MSHTEDDGDTAIIDRKDTVRTPKDKGTKRKTLMDGNSTKRMWRQASERPHPELPADAEANRVKKLYRVRLEPDLIALADIKAKSLNLTRQDYVESLFKKDLKL